MTMWIDPVVWASIGQVAFAFAAGLLLGMVFYGGLWWTVQRLTRTSQPLLLTLASFWLRTSICLLGFYLIMGESWRHLLVAGAGFLIARLWIVRLQAPVQQTLGGDS